MAAAETMSRRRAPGSRLAVAAAVIGLLTDALYLVAIALQDVVAWGRVAYVAVSMAVIAACGGAAALDRFAPAERLALLAAGSGGLIALGVLGIFSVGLPLLVGGILAMVAWARLARWAGASARVRLVSAAAFLVAGATPVVGIALT